ncbi:MAG TPA: hypothetical protein VH350_17770 [Candidatus Sulfotelmatobacter sp.]|nr:hypothetical protein [Candidatus Sulfotelmatobacter sp.]
MSGDLHAAVPTVSVPVSSGRTTTRKQAGRSPTVTMRLNNSLLYPIHTDGSAHSNTRLIIRVGKFGLNPPTASNRA